MIDLQWIPSPNLFQEYTDKLSKRHRKVSPRQILGVRMGLCGLRWHQLLGESAVWSNESKRLYTIVETDGSGADGVTIVTDCWLDRRTLRLFDYGKMAMTLIDRDTHTAVRILPSAESRTIALSMEDGGKWTSYKHAYEQLTDAQLLTVQPVELTISLEHILSKPGHPVNCTRCHEEIIKEREIYRDGEILCIPCATGEAYYQLLSHR